MTAKGDRVFLDNLKLFMTSGDELAKAIEQFYEPGGRLPYADDERVPVITYSGPVSTRPELILCAQAVSRPASAFPVCRLFDIFPHDKQGPFCVSR